MGKHRIKPNYRRRVLRLPDPDHCKLAVLNSLGSPPRAAFTNPLSINSSSVGHRYTSHLRLRLKFAGGYESFPNSRSVRVFAGS